MKTLNTTVSKIAAVTRAEGMAHLLCFMTLQVTPPQFQSNISRRYKTIGVNLLPAICN